MTDGSISDIDIVPDLFEGLDELPLSILFIGIGPANFLEIE